MVKFYIILLLLVINLSICRRKPIHTVLVEVTKVKVMNGTLSKKTDTHGFSGVEKK